MCMRWCVLQHHNTHPHSSTPSTLIHTIHTMASKKRDTATAAFLSQRQAYRDEVCATKPGRPGEYIVRVTSTCVPRSGEALRVAEIARREKQAHAHAMLYVSPTQNARELRALDAAIASHGGEHLTSNMSHAALNIALRITQSMMRVQNRIRQPDPIQRMNELVSRTKVADRMPDSSRHMVLLMTRNALRYARPPVSQSHPSHPSAPTKPPTKPPPTRPTKPTKATKPVRVKHPSKINLKK